MIKLYGLGPSRWVRPYWTLNELELEFEPIMINLLEGEHQLPEFLELNPFGKVPVLVDGDMAMYESGAICTYLADKYPDKGLAPAPGTENRARLNQWMYFCATELEQPLWRIARHTFIYPEEKRSPDDIELAKHDFSILAGTLERLIPEDGHMVGGTFSIADIMIAYTLGWARKYRLLDEHERLIAYADTHTARPAFPSHLYDNAG